LRQLTRFRRGINADTVFGTHTAHVRVEGLLTNTAPTCSYGGAGRPENVYTCERMVDMIARRIGQDPIAFRRGNLVQRTQMPWISPLGTRFEQHDFGRLFWALLASGQINMRKLDGWQTLVPAPIDQPIDLAA
jgi:aerobic carbon-monoxide dehydrogenase large subunit